MAGDGSGGRAGRGGGREEAKVGELMLSAVRQGDVKRVRVLCQNGKCRIYIHTRIHIHRNSTHSVLECLCEFFAFFILFQLCERYKARAFVFVQAIKESRPAQDMQTSSV